MAEGETGKPSRSEPARPLKLSHFDSRGVAGVVWSSEGEKAQAEGTLAALSSAFDTILKNIGDPSPDRDGLKRTPVRAAKALCYFTKGYEENLEGMVASNRWLWRVGVVSQPPPPFRCSAERCV